MLLEGRDVIGQAQTGTGKTAAFGLPLLDYIDPPSEDVEALVLTPTRELCIQVTQALRAYGSKKGIDVVAVFGGAPIREQMTRLNRGGGQVVVGTVGRVMDLMGRHALVLDSARFVVLDEADEMLDLGFLEDVETILSRTPSGRQTALFSATMPPPIAQAGRQVHVRPRGRQGARRDADDRHRRPVLRRGEVRPREGRGAGQGAEGRAARPGDHLLAHEDRRRPAVALAGRQGRAREDAARRHVAGCARRRDDRLQGRPREAARRHRHRRARARHLRRVARHQLRPAELARGLRAPHRPHGPHRPRGHGDHAGHAQAGARPGRDPQAREHRDRGVDRGPPRQRNGVARARSMGSASTPTEGEDLGRGAARRRPASARGSRSRTSSRTPRTPPPSRRGRRRRARPAAPAPLAPGRRRTARGAEPEPAAAGRARAEAEPVSPRASEPPARAPRSRRPSAARPAARATPSRAASARARSSCWSAAAAPTASSPPTSSARSSTGRISRARTSTTCGCSSGSRSSRYRRRGRRKSSTRSTEATCAA